MRWPKIRWDLIGWGALMAGCPIGLAIGFLGMTAGGFVAKCDGANELAMKQINSCEAATDILGAPIEQTFFGDAKGSSEQRGGGWGLAIWKIPVRGSRTEGSYSYEADMHAGTWTLTKGWLDASGRKVLVFPCESTWEGQVLKEAAGSEPLAEGLSLEGTVTGVSGRSQASQGQRCLVSVTPNPAFGKESVHNCRITVECGPTVLYGWEKSGYLTCKTDDVGSPTVAADRWGTAEDTDPIVELDVPSRRVVVRDDNPESTWSVEIGW